MIDDMRPYPKVRAIESPWVTVIPAHWEMRRTKTLLRERVEKGFPNLPLLAATQSKGVVAKSDYEMRTVTATKDLHLLKLVESGDFVISLRSFQGGIELAHARGIISPAYTILVPRQPYSRGYLRHFFKSPAFINAMGLFVTGIREGQNIDYERLARMEIPYPPPDEQAAIVRFLDHANRHIDQFIRAKQKLIALLNEEAQVIVHRAVTRGLDPSVKLKNSGVAWLGEIPAHWRVLRSKYLLREVDSRSPRGEETHLSMSQKHGLVPSSSLTERRFMSDSYAGGKLCEAGDLVLNRLKAHLGVFALAHQAGVISPDYTVLRPTAPMAPKYFEAVYRTPACRVVLRQKAKGIVQGFWRLYTDDFYDIAVPVPPVDEQETIVNGLAHNLAGVQMALAQAEREIALMSEYRTRLVADVVTGQLDVRAAATSLPDIKPAIIPTEPEGDDVDIEDSEAA